MNKTIYFVTSNLRKVEELNARLGKTGYIAKQLKAELVEKQSFDVQDVASSKLDHAIRLFPKKKLIVDDRGFFISALGGFPGTFVKLILSSLTIYDFLKLVEGKKDRKASFVTVLGYFDGRKKHFFLETEEGFLSKEPRGTNLRGWTDLLYIYGHKSHPRKTLAEYDDEEWSAYLASLEKGGAPQQLLRYMLGIPEDGGVSNPNQADGGNKKKT